MSEPPIRIRFAAEADLPLLVRLIRGLAEYERMLDECEANEAALREHLFGPRPYAEALIAEAGGEPAGFALFFHNYSTFRARPGIWLEDIFVLPEQRGHGLGKALFVELARVAAARGCARLEWSVLNWNEPSIGFYKRLGAQFQDEWTTCRLDGAELAALAGQ
ncbi:MAG TPA: GNAT family N-acetyltransferase [Dehalococcoidia bacterium]|nr:GNAT family N-acetyltransferase [Dehalococcoidia bacterium]